MRINEEQRAINREILAQLYAYADDAIMDSDWPFQPGEYRATQLLAQLPRYNKQLPFYDEREKERNYKTGKIIGGTLTVQAGNFRMEFNRHDILLVLRDWEKVCGIGPKTACHFYIPTEEEINGEF